MRLRHSAVFTVPAAALVAFLVLLLASASAAGGNGLTIPAIQGPAVSALSSAATPNQSCLPQITAMFTCYGPYQLGKAYNFPSNLDGRGQTILIVDAYGSPTIRSDLAAFDGYFGIPAPPSLTIINTRGTGASGSGATASWGVETSLDVEYAHAMAPGANIVLAVAATDNNADINAAEAQVFPLYPRAIVSQSFGDWETDSTAGNTFQVEHQLFELATAEGDTILASAGDAGATWTQYTGTTSPAIASYPASDPLVTGVGGTMGLPYPGGLYVNGAYGGEQVWNEPQYDAATGGAPSILFRAPSWQAPFSHNSMRTVPDVAYNAAINGGVMVVDSPYVYIVGGTSCGTPQWAAIFALLDQARAEQGRPPIGYANPALYAISGELGNGNSQGNGNWQGDGNAQGDGSPFHDITVGNNALDSTLGFSAGPGYDLASGLGTPNVANLIRDLVSVPSGTNLGFGWSGFPNGLQLQGPYGKQPHAADTMAPGA